MRADCRKELNTLYSEFLLVIVIEAAHKKLPLSRTRQRFECGVDVMYFCNELNETVSNNAGHTMEGSASRI